ncbi:energy transducer TonB [Rugamonas rubra]|uniref:energy transducer TonB n=1 Tax=Rugamonas rubra TaxID=758825 RepID=UPI001C2D23D8|nr:energy transducer TonB [Rugamonas rubra]
MRRSAVGKLPGLLLVLAVHLAMLSAAWRYGGPAKPAPAPATMVSLIAAPAPASAPRRAAAPPLRSKPAALLPSPSMPAAAALLSPPQPPPQPAPQFAPAVASAVLQPAPPAPPAQPGDGAAQAVQTALPAAPLALGVELALACPERPAPRYPAESRLQRESGVVVLRVALDASGQVTQASVHSSSGHRRLDEAAISAVRTWRCLPATRDGQPVGAVALQPFNFSLREA